MSVPLITGKVVAGHGVASGQSGDPRFPDGTLALQRPFFESRGLDLSGFHMGTINVSVKPLKPFPATPRFTFPKVKWHPDCAAEDFSFFDIRFSISQAESVDAFIYWPHPETKAEHFQDPHMVEVLAPRLDAIALGSPVRLWVDRQRMVFHS